MTPDEALHLYSHQ